MVTVTAARSSVMFLASLLFNAPDGVAAERADEVRVTVRPRITNTKVDGRRVLVDLSFENRSRQAIGIPAQMTVSDCFINSDIISVADSSGKEVRYSGIIAMPKDGYAARKMGLGRTGTLDDALRESGSVAITPDDEGMEKLEAGARLIVRGLDITDLFEFPAKPARLSVRIAAATVSSTGEREVVSPPATLSYSPIPPGRRRKEGQGVQSDRKVGKTRTITCAPTTDTRGDN
jgi:hypothetical protein